MTPAFSFTRHSDHDLLQELNALAISEREATARLIAALAEMDARRLYLRDGCASLFTYCTQVLLLSEHAAYGRIEAARAARRVPAILDLLGAGVVNLTTVRLIAPHLTDENQVALLERISCKSQRDVEAIVAALRPRPDVSSMVRKLPDPAHAAVAKQEVRSLLSTNVGESQLLPAAAGRPASKPAVITAHAPRRYTVQFTIDEETHEKLRRAQDLLRHSIPTGDPAAIFDRALTQLLGELVKRKLALGVRPASVQRRCANGGRHIPASVRREVWTRDAGQCAFVGHQGRCTERGFLEFHHVVPYADGGKATRDNIQLRCRSHDAYEADLWSSVEKA